MHQQVRRLGCYKPRQLPGVRKQDGTPTLDAEDEAATWEAHFADLLIGELLPHLLEPPPPDPPDPADLAEARRVLGPLLLRVRAVLAKMKGGKAVGPDQVPAELLQAGGEFLVQRIADVLERVLETGVLPVMWRGGRLARLYKGKGEPYLLDSFRGLLVANHVAKICTGVLIDPVRDAVETALPAQQCGGVRGRGTGHGHLLAASFVRFTRKHGRPSALIFLDLSKAFDRLVREVAFWVAGANGNPAAIASALRASGVPQEVVEHLVPYILEHGGLLEELLVPRHICDLVARLHEDTWFQLQAGGRFIVTRRGSRQGCRFGCVIFNAVYGVALAEVLEGARASGICWHAGAVLEGPPWAFDCSAYGHAHVEDVACTDVTYVDDEAVLITSDTNEELVASVRCVAELLQTVLSKHGMLVNWDPGKTEALVMWRGKRSRTLRRETQVGGAPGVLLACGIICRFVEQYKHLGCMLTATPSSAKEVRARIKKASGVYYSLVRKVFTQTRLGVALRVKLFQALVMSTLLYNSETWDITEVQLHWVHVFYLRCLRRIGGFPRAPDGTVERITDAEVLMRLGVPPIEGILRARRVSLAASIVRQPLAPLLALLEPHAEVPSQWSGILADDLALLWGTTECSALAGLGPPRSAWKEWQAFIKEHTSAWKAAVSALRWAVRLQAVVAAQRNDAGEIAAECVCHECGWFGLSRKAVATHRTREHGHRKVAHWHVALGAVVCPGCRRTFASRAVLLDRVEYRSKRRRALVLVGPRVLAPLAQAPG